MVAGLARRGAIRGAGAVYSLTDVAFECRKGLATLPTDKHKGCVALLLRGQLREHVQRLFASPA